MALEINVPLPEKLAFMLLEKARYKIAYGGRGSGKSWSAARALLVLAIMRKCRILCTREVQRSIKDSVHRLLKDQIEKLELTRHFIITREEIRCINGSVFLFAGLSDNTVESIKSFEGVDYCWVEEAQTVSKRSWEILIPTIRQPESEIWVTFNPYDVDDDTFRRFVTHKQDDALSCFINWWDNVWFPDELKKEKDYLYSVDPETADHVWGGCCKKVSDAQILRGRYRVQPFVPGDAWDGPYQGIDFGFAQDPGVFTRSWIWEHDLYVEYEAFSLEVETDLLPAFWDDIPDARKYVARADCSRPETISQVKRMGYKRVIACEKWPGCAEDGIEYLRSFRNIIIHPRCPETAREARLWSWKTDKLSGDILPKTTGKFDNSFDSIRYALQPMIQARLKKPVTKPKAEEVEEFPGMSRGASQHGWMQ